MSKTVRVPGRLLADTGRALFGEEWTGPLSRALGHNSPRTCQRWAQAARDGEDYQVSRSLLADVVRLASDRSAGLGRAARMLERCLEADAP